MKIITLNEESISTLLEEQFTKISEYINKFTFPVFVKHNDNNLTLYGSCISIRIAGTTYLCTASHLLKEIVGKDVVVGIKDDLFDIDISSAVHLDDAKVDHDIALIDITNIKKRIDHIFYWDLYIGDKYFHKSRQYLQGFPLSKNKKWDLIDHKKEIIKSGYLKKIMKIDQSIESPFKDIRPESHVFFRNDSGVYRKAGGELKRVKRNNLPRLDGLSGSGIWNVYDINDMSSIKLVGIFINFKNGIGAGTKAISITKLHHQIKYSK